ncbi:hypothetical protein LPU83_3401 [Rhizobium favelukesii]|uniref:Uncharacterized protein n=1 Tax=Rhizobium favelukesii TaxID=348824 RepID=W6RXR3_9HYPH|nr:hypothetical protein LPU83_3401 [Rhizobium favelukesii]
MKNWSLSNPKGAKLDWLATWRNWYSDKLDAKPKTPTTKAQDVMMDTQHPHPQHERRKPQDHMPRMFVIAPQEERSLPVCHS